MRGLIALTLIACASIINGKQEAQIFRWPYWNRNEKDNHGGYTFEYHDRHHLLIVRDNSFCYLIDAKPDVVKSYNDAATRASVEDDIISHIKANQDMHQINHFDALLKYHDPLQAAECVKHSIVELSYSLGTIATSVPQTSMPETTTAGATV
ncbi:hypothetical protein LOTGIDRAFT_228750 [Lottia gigantea]|uniref:BRICHOS domain-containing protein n=1 Tax=Lottia gigantea TaxID=225164 RepID=V4AD43_LOTGI|nr:hypothetical protein LOTGIDRAFT_228750 [Lottia gigantea]ESO91251.1 hypothetical protein LOTGIDRAFT_228750 [Lottia gigantea]